MALAVLKSKIRSITWPSGWKQHAKSITNVSAAAKKKKDAANRTKDNTKAKNNSNNTTSSSRSSSSSSSSSNNIIINNNNNNNKTSVVQRLLAFFRGACCNCRRRNAAGGSNGSDVVEVNTEIEQILHSMNHFVCLSSKYECPGVPFLMSLLLANIYAYFAHAMATKNVSSSDLISTSNVEMDKFIKVLDTLHKSLPLDLNMYRTKFPATNPGRLQDLKATIELLASISFFRIKVQGLASTPRTSTIVKDCIKHCNRHTYSKLFDNCDELYEIEFQNPGEPPGRRYYGGPGDVQFWNKLIALITSVIEEAKTSYATAFNLFPNEVNVGHLSAATLWYHLAADLQYALEEHAALLGLCRSADYLNCHFRVRWLYKTYVANVSPYKEQIPTYDAWFEPFVLQWLKENEEVSLELLQITFARDKENKFKTSTEHSNYSSSVVDVFTQLAQCLEVLQRLECQDPEIRKRYTRRFARTVVDVLTAYSDRLKHDFSNHVEDEVVAVTLMSNVRETRIQLEKMRHAMRGGQELDEEAAAMLNALQDKLNRDNDELAHILTWKRQ